MSLVFNEAALARLLESPDGPVGTRLRFIAADIEENYNAVVSKIWENQSPGARPNVGSDISFGDFGIQAEVGLTDPRERGNGRKSASGYMADKFQSGADAWIIPAIMAGWDNSL